MSMLDFFKKQRLSQNNKSINDVDDGVVESEHQGTGEENVQSASETLDEEQCEEVAEIQEIGNEENSLIQEHQEERLLCDKLDEPNIEICGKCREISYFGFSLQGASHVKAGVKCQDRCLVKIGGLKNNYIVAAIADGLGSCENSDIGASIAVNAAVEYVINHISDTEGVQDDTIISAIKSSMIAAYDEIEAYSKKQNHSLFAYCSTLTIVVYFGNVTYIGHAGDDGVVLINKKGKYGLVTTRHKGDEASSVFPLQSKDTWEFLKVEDVVCAVMATDGVLDAFVRGSRENNQVFFPLIEPITTMDTANGKTVQDVAQIYRRFMDGDAFRSVVKDDITLLAIANTETMAETHFSNFDLQKWIEHNKKRNIEIYEALYPNQRLTNQIIASWRDDDSYLLESLHHSIQENNRAHTPKG